MVVYICRISYQIIRSSKVIMICISFLGDFGSIFIRLLMLVFLPHQLSAGFRHVAALLLEPAVTTCWGNPAESQSAVNHGQSVKPKPKASLDIAGTSHLGIFLNNLKFGGSYKMEEICYILHIIYNP